MLIRKNKKHTSIDNGKKFLLFLCFVLQIKQWVLALNKLGWWKMHLRETQVKIKIFINQKILFQFLLLIYHIWCHTNSLFVCFFVVLWHLPQEFLAEGFSSFSQRANQVIAVDFKHAQSHHLNSEINENINGLAAFSTDCNNWTAHKIKGVHWYFNIHL